MSSTAVGTKTVCIRTAIVLGLGVVLLTGLRVETAKPSAEWTPPLNVGETVNSSFNEFLPALSRNGLSLYFASDRPGSLGAEDLWVSQRERRGAPWSEPVNLGALLNTTFNERSPELSRDGHLLFFATDRPGGFGGFDIWVAWRAHTHDDFAWQPAVNLGAGVNGVFGDFGPSYFPNDKIGIPTLFFASARPGGLGNADIYRSELTRDGSFGAATAVAELNSPQGDFRPSIRGDGLEIVFDSNRPGPPDVPGIGLRDLWRSTRRSASMPWSVPENLGPAVNTPMNDSLPMLSSNGRTLVFASDRAGGFGGSDLYIATRPRQSPGKR